MSEKQGSYRNIMKATSLFGGVQIFNIIISIIRSKFIAILLGPAGMGISGLLTATTGLIGNMTEFGLGSSAVKNVSAANATNDSHKIGAVVSVLRRLVWITGLLGTVVTLCFAPLLSQLTFGNKDYTVAFVFLSITLLFIQLRSGQLVVLQGMRKLKYLAKSDFIGMIIGLVISVPIYYIWGIKGIVPAIIITAVSNLVLSSYFASKVKTIKVDVTKTMLKTEGVDMVRMGVMLSLSSFITLGASYVIRIFISRTGGVDQVGLYTAGFAIINTYVGLVFTAMGTDYYPRLSGVSHDNAKSAALINQQAEIAILILAPILAGFLVFIKWAVILLYSHKFLSVNGMIHWAVLGMFFKAASWAIGFILLAKGASRLFFWNELISNIYILILNIIGYNFFGLDGLGISFMIGYVLHLFQIYIVSNKKYQFKFENAFYKIFIIQFLLGLLCFITVKVGAAPWSYLTGSLFILLSVGYSYIELDKRLNIKHILVNLAGRIKKRE